MIRKYLYQPYAFLFLLAGFLCLKGHAQIRLLPLHQFELKATLQGTSVSLDWVAENEVNAAKFVLERSKDGNTYFPIGTEAVTGPVNSTTHYQFPDDISSLLSAGLVYYRVKMENSDGRFAYSNIAVVKLGMSAGAQVWPNPFEHTLHISYASTTNSRIEVSLLDNYGKLFRQSLHTISRGLNQVSILGLDRLGTGIYFIRITDMDSRETYVQQLVK